MGAYKYIAETLQKQYKARDDAFRQKIIEWRAGPAMARVEYPANLARARRLGYQAKQGYVIVRTRIDKGRRTRRKPMGGRKHKNNYRFVQPQMSHQAIAEQRVNREYRNMEVLNSYWVGEDGNYKYFEVILADPSKPSVNISSAIRGGKAFRGLTSAGNSRGPSKKKGDNKKLRRKLYNKKAYHFEEYVKKEQAPAQKAAKAPKKAAAKMAPSAHAAAKTEHPHTPVPALSAPHVHAHAPAHANEHAQKHSAVEHARASALEHAHQHPAPHDRPHQHAPPHEHKEHEAHGHKPEHKHPHGESK